MTGAFEAIERMWAQRVERARDASDTDLFLNLMYLGEMITKVVTAGLTAAVVTDREQTRYGHIYRLVRADGLGEWSSALDDILSSRSSHLILPHAQAELLELTQRSSSESWQYEAIDLLIACIRACGVPVESPSTKVSGRAWFDYFVQLRNKTRGHRAQLSGVYTTACPLLEQSVRLITDNLSILYRPWAYIHRNISGKHRVTSLSSAVMPFSSEAGFSEELPNGLYICFNKPQRVDLIQSDVDAQDFFFPNGHFNGKRFELLSYDTDHVIDGDGTQYLAPPTGLPSSETEGLRNLDVQGGCFGNLPPVQRGYIKRTDPEKELHRALTDDRHPMVTLVGQGGIGKTSMALKVLYDIAKSDVHRFETIVWFSARDIDLLPEGPKPVRPQVLTERDMAKDFVSLVLPSEASHKDFNPIEYLAENLRDSPIGPVLFVFDNFETVNSPIDVFTWIDTHVRSPNKVLITTRSRSFKGDYPIDVEGMSEAESAELIDSYADTLRVKDLLTREYRRQLHRESDGHPYVIKVLLGEVAKAGRLVRIERTLASRDEMLAALFERTFLGLSLTAKRLFLTLCNCRSIVPRIALEAVLLRSEDERVSVEKAIDEVITSSFADVIISREDENEFLTVPLVAVQYGKRKLSASPLKSGIETDTPLLIALSTTRRAEIHLGIGPRIENLFGRIAGRDKGTMRVPEEDLPILEFIARRYPPAELLLASVYQAYGSQYSLEDAKNAVRRYLESPEVREGREKGWEMLIRLCRRTDDVIGELHALVERAQVTATPFWTISSNASDVVNLWTSKKFSIDTEESRAIINRLANVMEERSEEANATDCSRLAWLYLLLDDPNKAWIPTMRGLEMEPTNSYCVKLRERLDRKFV